LSDPGQVAKLLENNVKAALKGEVISVINETQSQPNIVLQA